jgi:hypothetical protein
MRYVYMAGRAMCAQVTCGVFSGVSGPDPQGV